MYLSSTAQTVKFKTRKRKKELPQNSKRLLGQLLFTNKRRLISSVCGNKLKIHKKLKSTE